MLPTHEEYSDLDPNAPEFFPQSIVPQTSHFLTQESCRRRETLGLECVLNSSSSRLPIYFCSNTSVFEDATSKFSYSKNCTANTADIIFNSVRHRLLILACPKDIAVLIADFARPQYEIDQNDVLLHEGHWTNEYAVSGDILDLCSDGSCAWIHPRLPQDIQQNFQVLASVAFCSSDLDDAWYNSMSESEEACELEYEPCFPSMDLDFPSSPDVCMDFVEMELDQSDIDLNIHDFRPLRKRIGRILSESLICPRWEIICEEDLPLSCPRTVQITFNLWTHKICSNGQREFLRNSLSMSVVVHDPPSQFEWHNIAATWSRTKMQMHLRVDDEFTCSFIRGYIPLQPVIYGNDTYQNREIAIGKDLLLSDDKFYGFVRSVAVDVWDDE